MSIAEVTAKWTLSNRRIQVLFCRQEGAELQSDAGLLMRKKIKKRMEMNDAVKVYWFHKKEERPDFIRMMKACSIPEDVFDGYVGFAELPLRTEPVPILVSDELLRESRMLFAGTIVCGIDGKDYTIIPIGDLFYKDLQRSARLESVIYHELGHIACGHLESMMPMEQINRERVAIQKDGSVPAEEQEADRFAIMRSSKEDVLYGLRYMRDRADMYLKARGVSAANRQTARREVENRIQLLKKMEQ